eukprot:7990065-Pyramimonas_sp.AAC.1
MHRSLDTELAAGTYPPGEFQLEDKRFKYSNGDSYEGQAINGNLRHGRGVHNCANGDVYGMHAFQCEPCILVMMTYARM